MEPNLVGRHGGGGSYPISYAVYPRRLDNKGMKSLHIGICICIDLQVLWKKWRSYDVSFTADNTENHRCCRKLRALNTWNFSGVSLPMATYHLSD
ncbi:hypothetical protein ACTXT7_005350 [Hymenolepis weldensis]